ncbi:hypothetical protein DIPPA_02076 [Diplonema papillatum]|nr:hypothetical protein DIPPA_02076 [Diplonema papillatum]
MRRWFFFWHSCTPTCRSSFIWACLTPDADDRPTLLVHPFLANFASDTVHFIPVIGQASARPCSVEAQKHYLRR